MNFGGFNPKQSIDMTTKNFKPNGKYNLTPCWTVNGEEFKSLAEAKRYGANQYLHEELKNIFFQQKLNEDLFKFTLAFIEDNATDLMPTLAQWTTLMPTEADMQHDTAVIHGSLSPEAAEEAVTQAEHIKDILENR